MKKHILASVLSPLAGFAQIALAAWAEFGEQKMLPGYKANSAYTTLGSNTKYIIVAQVGAYGAVQATDPTSSTILGVMQNQPDRGKAVSIAYAGPTKVVAGGALTAGAIITTNASGRAAVVRSGDVAIGRVLETAGADGDVVSALLFHPVRWFGVP